MLYEHNNSVPFIDPTEIVTLVMLDYSRKRKNTPRCHDVSQKPSLSFSPLLPHPGLPENSKSLLGKETPKRVASSITASEGRSPMRASFGDVAVMCTSERP